MWISSDLTLAAAEQMVVDLSKKKRLAFHVLSLKMSRVSREVLEMTELMPALSRHAFHPGIGIAVRGLLDRFMAICDCKEDEVNGLFETMTNPFRQPLERKNSKFRVEKVVQKERDSKGSEFSDTENSEVDYSDTDSEDEARESSATASVQLEVKKESVESQHFKPTTAQEFINHEVQERHANEKPVTETRQKSLGLKRNIEEEYRPPKTARKEQEKPRDHLDSVVDSLVSKIFEEAASRPKIDSEKNIKKDLTPKFEKTGEESKPKYAPWLLNGKENILPKEFGKPTMSVPGTGKFSAPNPRLSTGTLVNPVRVLSKNQRNTQGSSEKKKMKEENMSRKTKQMTAGLEIFQVSKVKKEVKVEPAEIPEQEYTLPEDIKKLVDKLNVLPLEPSRAQISAILPSINARILSEAEKLIGRNMRRVDRVWWELLSRDFDPIDHSQNAGDVRDIYAARQMLVDRKKLREKAARLPPNPLERVFASLPGQ